MGGCVWQAAGVSPGQALPPSLAGLLTPRIFSSLQTQGRTTWRNKNGNCSGTPEQESWAEPPGLSTLVSLLHWQGDLRAREEMLAPGSLRGRQKSGDQNTNACLFIQRSVRESPWLPGVNKGGIAGRAEWGVLALFLQPLCFALGDASRDRPGSGSFYVAVCVPLQLGTRLEGQWGGSRAAHPILATPLPSEVCLCLQEG